MEHTYGLRIHARTHHIPMCHLRQHFPTKPTAECLQPFAISLSHPFPFPFTIIRFKLQYYHHLQTNIISRKVLRIAKIYPYMFFALSTNILIRIFKSMAILFGIHQFENRYYRLRERGRKREWVKRWLAAKQDALRIGEEWDWETVGRAVAEDAMLNHFLVALLIQAFIHAVVLSLLYSTLSIKYS